MGVTYDFRIRLFQPDEYSPRRPILARIRPIRIGPGFFLGPLEDHAVQPMVEGSIGCAAYFG